MSAGTSALARDDRVLTVTLHDVAPATLARCREWVAQIERVAPLPLTLLVVPHYGYEPSTPEFEHWLDERLGRGDELALHGLTHRDDGPPPRSLADRLRRRVYTASEGEFAALDAADATQRMNAGRRWFDRRGWTPRGFVAPAWLLSDEAWVALRGQPFDYTCTFGELLALQAPARRLRAHPIVYSTRAPWRRGLSQATNHLVGWGARRRMWMRLELHPSDVEHRAVCDAALRILASAAADASREPLTLAALADRLPALEPANGEPRFN